MTYRELAKAILDFDEVQLQMDVMIAQENEEVFAAKLNVTNESCGILNANHPILEIEA